MKSTHFYKVFLDYVQDLYDAENQIVVSLPEMISEAKNEDLKKGLTDHLKETKEQVKRLEKVFHLLGEQVHGKSCKAMKGLIDEAKEVVKKCKHSSTVKDCFIIISAQKIEHYEISAYGSALALAKHMKAACKDKTNYNEICTLFNKTLQEEGHADKLLTKIAEGKLFFDGVNDELEQELKVRH